MTTKEKEQVPANLLNGTQATPRRAPNAELQTMARIDRILAEMDEQSMKRVVAYFAHREFGGQWTLTPPEAK